MNIVNISLRRPVTILVAVLAVCLGGWLAIQRMSRDVFPPLGIPTIYVAQPFGGMDAAQMEGFLTYYYEYHFLYITGIEHVESKSIQGASIMKLQFHPGTDMSAAMAETVAYVNRARAFMPPGTPGPFITRFDAGSVPVGHLVFSTENPTRTVGQMQDAALNMVRPLFATLPGVSAPPPFGGGARTIVVNVKPDRLRALSLSPDEIVQAIAQANVISPSGNMNLGDRYPVVPVNAVVKNIKDLEGVPLRVTPGAAVFIRDVATVDDQSDITTSYALVNGRRTVYMPVTKRADASTLAVVGLVKANLPKFKAAVPDDVNVTFEFDQTPVVTGAMNNLVKEGALGAVLTGLMVLLFLRSVRSAIIVVINIPIALLAATLALWLTGNGIHLMTLGGLALAVGILVDEATVAIENIHAHLARGASPARAALDGTLETAVPRFLAMLCVLAVFAPVFFMVGAAKALFAPLALAVGFSMAASFVLSSTLVPILCVWLLRGKQSRKLQQERGAHASSVPREASSFVHEGGQENEAYALQDAGADVSGRMPDTARWKRALPFSFVFRAAIATRWILVPAYLAAAVLVVWVFGRGLGVEIFPQADAGQLAVRLRAPAGTRIEVTEPMALRALDLIKREAGADNVKLTMGLVGVHAANYPVNLIHLWNGGPEEVWLAVQFRPNVRVPKLREKLRAVFAKELPEARVSFEPADIVSRVMSFGSSTPIEVAVSGPDLALSRAHAEKLLEKLRTIKSLRDVQIAQELDFPAVPVEVNRERAGLLGVREADVARSLVAATTSSRFTTPVYWGDPKTGVSYSVQVQIPQTLTKSAEDLRNIPIAAAGGKSVPLRSVATVGSGTVVGQYERYNMARTVSITANIHGAALGQAAEEVRKAIAEVGAAPAKTNVAVRGQITPLEEMLGGFRSGLIVAIVVIALLLAANFQSFRLALAVMSTVPAVLAGVVLMLWLTRTTLNIQSAIGSIMAVGVAIANAILLVTFAERARREGRTPVEAALAGAAGRLRPILMTSCAMCAGMLPMALGFGESGAQTAPLGRAVLGGLAAATVATLFILPCVFALVTTRKVRSVSLDPDDSESSHHVLPTPSAP
ncbi:MAG: efflux RND transporter permease subunit [Chthoniobacteraceae bacterium]